LAQGGTLFTSIDAQIPLTLLSHTSLLISTYPFANQIEENGAIIGPGTGGADFRSAMWNGRFRLFIGTRGVNI
jgi:hypothetical protein